MQTSAAASSAPVRQGGLAASHGGQTDSASSRRRSLLCGWPPAPVNMHLAQCVVGMLLATAALGAQAPGDRLLEELGHVKHIMMLISAELEKFNTLYLSKLEHRLVNIASLMSSIDSNVKNLQERAHVWDTFQLHVAAWNEQISSLDKKIDILNRGQQKLEVVEGKLGPLQLLEDTVQRVARQLDATDSRVAGLAKAMEHHRRDATPLLGDFATRGVLSTLRLLERKVDRLHMAYRGRRRDDLEDPKGKLVIRCNTPVIVEEMLRDISSKVDVMFDKMADGSDFDDDEDQVHANELRELHETRLMEKLWKRLQQPLRKTSRALDSVQAAVRRTENATSACCRASDALLSRLEAAQAARASALDARFQRVEAACAAPSQRPDEGVEGSGVSDAEAEDLLPLGGCEDLLGAAAGAAESRLYQLGPRDLNARGRDFNARFCDMHTDGGGWTVIQRRGEFPGERVNFSRTWEDYRHGFGDLNKEFWFGNDYIHRLSHQKDLVLRVDLEAFDGRTAWAEYNLFRVASAQQGYRLSVGGYAGNASDSLAAHHGAQFSARDRRHDVAPPCCPCAPSYGGGWWFVSCFEANLNGQFFAPNETREPYRGIIWQYWLGDQSLRKAEMKVRPRGDADFQDGSPTPADAAPPLPTPDDP